jgi:hypothetical protein
MKTCVIPNCGEAISPSHLMCQHHWRMVPKQLQTKVWSTWKALLRERTQKTINAYYSARGDAIEKATNWEKQEISLGRPSALTLLNLL